MDAKLEILFEDRHLVAVAKPARIPVASEDSGDQTLLGMVRDWNVSRQGSGKKGYCVPIHFLDRPVSGVILFALSSKAATRLNEMFRRREMNKTYVAITSRPPREPQATLEHWLAKDHDENRSQIVTQDCQDAKKCVLSYKVLLSASGRSIAEVKPVTGRSHQIRAQMAAIGAPLMGDVKYGAASGWDGKIALHAARLDFKHPVGGAPMRIFAPLPEYWREIWSSDFPESQDILFPRGDRS
jgi:23S rRNA pseudouridine1911/1915/1917 synthase